MSLQMLAPMCFTQSLDITPPVACRLKVKPTFENVETLRTAKAALETFLGHSECRKQLHEENTVLERLIYKRNGQLRNMKMLQGLKQVCRNLRKLFVLKLNAPLSEFLQDFDSAVIEEEIATHLPSRQTAEYILVHLIRVSAVLTNVTSRCKSVFLDVHLHLTTGNLIGTNLVCLALLSRIWVCCEALLYHVRILYKAVYPVKDILSPTEVTWLPENEVLPSDITPKEEKNVNIRADAVRDELSLLLERTAGGAGVEEEEEEASQAPPASRQKEPVPSQAHDEDLGAPVSVNDVEMKELVLRREEVDKNQRQLTKPSQKVRRQPVVVQLRENIETASTVDDLLVLLKQGKQLLPHLTDTEIETCAASLSSLQTRCQAAERKKNSKRVQKLLTLGKKKLLNLLKSAKQKSVNGNKKDEKLEMESSPPKKKRRGRKRKRAENSTVEDVCETEHTKLETASEDGTVVSFLSPKRSKLRLGLRNETTDSGKQKNKRQKESRAKSKKTAAQKEDSNSSSKPAGSLLSSRQQLSKVLITLKKKNCFKLKGTLFELPETEALETVSRLIVIKKKLNGVDSKKACDNLLDRATKKLWRAVRGQPELRAQWKALKRGSLQ